MVKCPKCGSEIESVKGYSLEENVQQVTLSNDKKNPLDWDKSDPVDDTCEQIEFECPDCGNVLYRNKGNSQDPVIAKFLRTGKLPPLPAKSVVYEDIEDIEVVENEEGIRKFIEYAKKLNPNLDVEKVKQDFGDFNDTINNIISILRQLDGKWYFYESENEPTEDRVWRVVKLEEAKAVSS